MAAGLPRGVFPYRRTPVFTEHSIPAGLRRLHRTRPGVWALIHVLEGWLLYRILGDPITEQELTPETPGVVPPEQPHEVIPRGPVRFFVEFHAATPPQGSPHAPSDPPA